MKGPEVIKALAEMFPQLYVAPAEGAQEAHKAASSMGVVPSQASLDHFITSEEDELREVDTPAGPVEVVFLKERADFETFLQIIGHKSQPVQIARTVGAITYRGLADWQKVAQAREEYLASGGDNWNEEFARLAKEPGAFRSEIVVISEGPYSNIPASETPYSPADWIRISREIRLYHECSHIVCRRLLPNDILPVWDEITADVVGLICATGRYDASLAARFLGTSSTGFLGGRLSEYLSDNQLKDIDTLAAEVHQTINKIESTQTDANLKHPFDFLLDLKRKPLITY